MKRRWEVGHWTAWSSDGRRQWKTAAAFWTRRSAEREVAEMERLAANIFEVRYTGDLDERDEFKPQLADPHEWWRVPLRGQVCECSEPEYQCYEHDPCGCERIDIATFGSTRTEVFVDHGPRCRHEIRKQFRTPVSKEDLEYVRRSILGEQC